MSIYNKVVQIESIQFCVIKRNAYESTLQIDDNEQNTTIADPVVNRAQLAELEQFIREAKEQLK